MSKSTNKSSGSSPLPSGDKSLSMWRRLLPCIGFVLGFLVLAVLVYDDGYGALPPVEKRYAATRAAVDVLRMDAKRNIYRDQWLKLADEYYDIYRRDNRWPNRPAALYRSAEVLEELGGRSFAERDYKAAVERYELLAKENPTSRLADDALLRVASITANKLDDKEGALRVLQRIRTQYPRGDMTSDALELERELRAEAKANASAAKQSSAAQGGADNQRKTNKDKNAPAAKDAAMASLTQVSWTSLGRDKVQITVELNRHAPWQVRMRDADKKGASPRLVLEMDDTVPAEQVQAGARVKGSLLTRVLVNKNKNNTTALMFDFTAARRYDARVEQNPFRIVLTVTAGNAAPSRGVGSRLGFAESTLPEPETYGVAEARVNAVRSAAERLREAEKVADMAKVERAERAEKAERESVAKAKPGRPDKADKKDKADTARNVATASSQAAKGEQERNARRVGASATAVGGSMAEQLGLTVQTVFIDAGHGGKDPGTIHNGIVERDVVLDIARRVGRLLNANGIDVVFSRSSDIAVPLSSRPQKANRARADLFVSIHVNAHSETNISGFETFYLDLARNAQAARVATLENAASDRKLGDMQSVLADVMLNARTQESSRLAGDIQRRAVSRLGRRGFEVKDGGTRSAPFHVLIGAGMPAVLVEVGYCTNPSEAKRLTSANYRHALSEGIAEGIMAYKDRLQVRHSAQFSLTSSALGAI